MIKILYILVDKVQTPTRLISGVKTFGNGLFIAIHWMRYFYYDGTLQKALINQSLLQGIWVCITRQAPQTASRKAARNAGRDAARTTRRNESQNSSQKQKGSQKGNQIGSQRNSQQGCKKNVGLNLSLTRIAPSVLPPSYTNARSRTNILTCSVRARKKPNPSEEISQRVGGKGGSL